MNPTDTILPQFPAAAAQLEREEVGAALLNLEPCANNFIAFQLFNGAIRIGLDRDGVDYEPENIIHVASLLASTFLVSNRNAALRSLRRTMEEFKLMSSSVIGYFNGAEGAWFTSDGFPVPMGMIFSEENSKATVALMDARKEWMDTWLEILQKPSASQPPETS